MLFLKLFLLIIEYCIICIIQPDLKIIPFISCTEQFMQANVCDRLVPLPTAIFYNKSFTSIKSGILHDFFYSDFVEGCQACRIKW